MERMPAAEGVASLGSVGLWGIVLLAYWAACDFCYFGQVANLKWAGTNEAGSSLELAEKGVNAANERWGHGHDGSYIEAYISILNLN